MVCVGIGEGEGRNHAAGEAEYKTATEVKVLCEDIEGYVMNNCLGGDDGSTCCRRGPRNLEELNTKNETRTSCSFCSSVCTEVIRLGVCSGLSARYIGSEFDVC